MKLIKLTQDYTLTKFDCGDNDLNEFLSEDSKAFSDKRIANTFILEDEGSIVAYVQLTQKDEDAHTRLMYFDMMRL